MEGFVVTETVEKKYRGMREIWRAMEYMFREVLESYGEECVKQRYSIEMYREWMGRDRSR